MVKKVLLRCLKWLGITSAVLIILFAILINVARAAIPLLNDKRDYLEKWVSAALHQPVHIGHLNIGWYGFDPVLRFGDVMLKDPEHRHALLRVKQLSVSINLFSSLAHWKLLPGHLVLSGTRLDVFQDGTGNLRVKGIVGFQGQQTRSDLGYSKDVLLWMLTQSDIAVKNVDVNFHTSDGGLLPIHNIQLSVSNGVLHHQITGFVSIQQKIPTRLHFVLNLNSTHLRSSGFGANLYVNVKHINFSQWVNHQYLQPYLKKCRVTRGQVDAQVWAQWRGGVLKRVQSLVNGRNIGLHLAEKKSVSIPCLDANLVWQHFADGWGIAADHVKLCMNGKDWPEHDFAFRRFNAQKNIPMRVLLRSTFFRLEDIRALANSLGYWPPAAQRMYVKLKPRGDFYGFNALVSLRDGKPIDYQLNTQFQNVGISASKKIPGVSGLNGGIHVTPTEGRVTLLSQRSSIVEPHLFSHALRFDALHLKASWQHNAAGWKVHTSQLALGDAMIKMRGGLALSIPKTGSPVIDLLTAFRVSDIGHVRDYLPTRVLKPHLHAWLSHAFLRGDATGELIFNGPINDFPFDQHQGHFEVSVNLDKATLNYHHAWPVMKNLNAMLIFDNRGMNVYAKGGIEGNPLDHVHAVIPDLKKPILTVTGQAASDLKNGFQFLRASPLPVGKSIAGIHFSGPMDLNIKLLIPLRPHQHKVIASGSVDVKNGHFQLGAGAVSLTGINGLFHFNDNDLSASHVSAKQEGLPLTFDITTLGAKTSSPVLQGNFSGEVSVASLREKFKLPLLKYFKGVTTYRALLNMHDERSSLGSSFSLISDLKGILSTLPPPYQKAAAQIRPLLAKLHIKKHQVTTELNYSDAFSLAAAFGQRNGHLHFTSGEIHLGEGQAHLQTVPGLTVSGQLHQVDWQQWKTVLNNCMGGSGFASEATSAREAQLRNINLTIDQLKLFNTRLSNLHLNLTPKSQGWVAKVESPVATGDIYIPNNHRQRWYVYFKHLYLPVLKGVTHKKVDPCQIPPLDFVSDELRYGNSKMGRVQLQTTPTESGLQINKLAVAGPLFKINSVGTWQVIHGRQESSAFGYFGSSNLGAVLKNWHLAKVMEGGKGVVHYSLAWPGAPYQFKATHLIGDLTADFRNGRVTQMGKGAGSELGLGRLLNLFSLQSIPRLPLNLVHLTKKGFEFDFFKGSFTLNDGNAETKNSSLVGPIAWVQMNGNVGFADTNYDLRLKIIPNVTSSLPLIVGILGGPLVGAITWVANEMLANQLGKVAQINYHITGSWAKPSIEKLPQPAQTRKS
jgi:uncharacterized protein (TIGR02099 family)